MDIYSLLVFIMNKFQRIVILLLIVVISLLFMCFLKLKSIDERDELNRGLIWEIVSNTDNVESLLGRTKDEIESFNFEYSMNN